MSGEQALRRYRGHAFHQLAVEVLDVLEGCGLPPHDTDAPGGEAGGVSLAPEKDGVAVSWSSQDDMDRRVYDESGTGLRLRTSGAVLTGAASAVLLAHGFHVRAEYLDALPMPRLLVTGRQ